VLSVVPIFLQKIFQNYSIRRMKISLFYNKNKNTTVCTCTI